MKAAAALALLAGAAVAAEPGPTRGNLAGVAWLTLPPGLTMAAMEGPDFRVVHVIERGTSRRILSVYLGNAPQFPRLQGRYAGEPAVFGPCAGLALARRENGQESLDALVEVIGPSGWPTFLHLFFRELDADAARQAKEVAISLAMAPGFRCAATSP